VAALVLVVEYVVTTLLVDARDLARGFALPGLQYLGEAARGLALIAGATLLYGGPAILRALRSSSPSASTSSPSWRYFAAHLLSFALLAQLTVWVAYGEPTGGALAFVVWLALGLGAVYLLVRFALRPDQLQRVRRPLAKALGAGTLAGGSAWAVGKAATFLWPVVSSWTLRLSALQLRAFTAEVEVDYGSLLLGAEGFRVLVAPICSGLEGVGLALVLAGAYVVHARKSLRFPNALLLIPLSAVTIWLLNTTRIALLVLVGARLSPTIAVSGFHSKAGWVFFIVIAFATVWLSRTLPFFAHPEAEGAEPEERDNPTLIYLGPLIALLATMMITGLFALEGFDPLYFVRVVVVLAVIWRLRDRYEPGTFAPSLVGLVLGVVTFGVWMLLSPHAEPAPMPAAMAGLSPGVRGAWLVGRVAGAIVAIPVAEELAFRGFLLRRLQAHDFVPSAVPRFTLLSFLGSSLLFALVHESEMLPALLVGMLFAVAYLWRGRLGDAIWAHALCNGLVAAYVLAAGAFALW